MVAKRDINPGEVIFTDQPAVIGQYYLSSMALEPINIRWIRTGSRSH